MKHESLIKATGVILGVSVILITAAGCANMRFVRNASPRLEEQVWEELQALVGAYERQQITDFMERIDEDFIGQDRILESAVRHDFSRFAHIDLNINLVNSARSFRGGQIHLTVRFNRQLIPVATGEPVSDSGQARFIFKRANDTWKLWSVGGDLIFGVTPEI